MMDMTKYNFLIALDKTHKQNIFQILSIDSILRILRNKEIIEDTRTDKILEIDLDVIANHIKKISRKYSFEVRPLRQGIERYHAREKIKQLKQTCALTGVKGKLSLTEIANCSELNYIEKMEFIKIHHPAIHKELMEYLSRQYILPEVSLFLKRYF
jgi:hypothetical protein